MQTDFIAFIIIIIIINAIQKLYPVSLRVCCMCFYDSMCVCVRCAWVFVMKDELDLFGENENHDAIHF